MKRIISNFKKALQKQTPRHENEAKHPSQLHEKLKRPMSGGSFQLAKAQLIILGHIASRLLTITMTKIEGTKLLRRAKATSIGQNWC